VAADWYELMIPQRTVRLCGHPQVTGANEQATDDNCKRIVNVNNFYSSEMTFYAGICLEAGHNFRKMQ